KEGQKLRVLISPAGGRPQPVRVIGGGDAGVEAVVALFGLGQYVPGDVQNAGAPTAAAGDSGEKDDGGGGRLFPSVYESALRSQIPRPVIADLIRVYSYDVDFQRKTQPGDSFEVLYVGEDENPDSKADVLYASLTIGGEVRKFYRYQTGDDGLVDYYDES